MYSPLSSQLSFASGSSETKSFITMNAIADATEAMKKGFDGLAQSAIIEPLDFFNSATQNTDFVGALNTLASSVFEFSPFKNTSEKLGNLLQVLEASNAAANGQATANQAVLLDSVTTVSDFVVIDAVSETGDGADLLPMLESFGLQHGASFGAYASGLLPFAAILDLQNLDILKTAQAAFTEAFVGAVENEAQQSLNVDDARDQFGVDGSGVTIGILSDSFDANGIAGGDYATDILTGDLPDDVLILEDLAFGSDEGRAMAQLIHDIAPGADLQFSSAFLGIANFAQSIIDLREAGSDIIVDDIRYFAEPIYSDGVIAQAVDQVTQDGAVYFSSAGNQARLAYDSVFRNSGEGVDYLGGDGIADGFAHDFDPDPDSTVTSQRITLGPGASFNMSFQWDDPFFSDTGGQAANDSDMDVIFRIVDGSPFGLADGTIVAGSAVDNLLTGDPVELVGIANPLAGQAIQLDVQLIYFDDPSNSEPGRLTYTLFDSGTVTIDTFDTESSTIWGHAAAAGAVAVGASFFPLNSAEDFEAFFGIDPELVGFTVPAVNEFSSGGASEILFDANGNRLDSTEIRATPQISAADGTSTTVPGFASFFGTSAAAPNVAAITALAAQLVPDLSRAEALTVLEETASDVVFREGFLFGRPDIDEVLPEGADFDSGAGIVQADLAIQFLFDLNDLGRNDLKIVGTVDNDDLSGGNGNDRLFGGLGNDEIAGGNRNDFIFGNEGADDLSGGNGNDLVSGGAGDDLVNGGNGNDILRGATGNDILNGGNGRDSIDAGIGDDILNGGNSRDTLNGGGGDDTLNGGNGRDFLDGGAGNDTLVAGNGNDTLVGDLGDDFLTGNNGRDTFVFDADLGATDTVTDLNTRQDNLVFNNIDIIAASLVDGDGDGRIDDVALSLSVAGQSVILLNTALGDAVVINGQQTVLDDFNDGGVAA